MTIAQIRQLEKLAKGNSLLDGLRVNLFEDAKGQFHHDPSCAVTAGVKVGATWPAINSSDPLSLCSKCSRHYPDFRVTLKKGVVCYIDDFMKAYDLFKENLEDSKRYVVNDVLSALEAIMQTMFTYHCHADCADFNIWDAMGWDEDIVYPDDDRLDEEGWAYLKEGFSTELTEHWREELVEKIAADATEAAELEKLAPTDAKFFFLPYQVRIGGLPESIDALMEFYGRSYGNIHLILVPGAAVQYCLAYDRKVPYLAVPTGMTPAQIETAMMLHDREVHTTTADLRKLVKIAMSV